MNKGNLVEHDSRCLNQTNSNYIYAPIKQQNGYNWYDNKEQELGLR